ncbi:hypothetical protein DY000_02026804 [Brassica cretica]|uniref:Uncharacterized protein n=1 Tax=Brassica cretica TaxID=69181 RepID=A0ABQ7EFD1_BRACR|nr:hypothetical protein DY000_02026804 [Brassica cretica]
MVEVRLLRFWEARNSKRGGHLMVVGMLILDSKARSCPQHRCEPSSHLPVTLEGACSKFSMSGFDITRHGWEDLHPPGQD